MAAAVGFDLGETLLTYADTPLNWAALCPTALAEVTLTVAAPMQWLRIRAQQPPTPSQSLPSAAQRLPTRSQRLPIAM